MGITGLMIFVKPLTKFFQFETMNISQFGFSVGIGMLSVLWFEIVKWGKTQTNKSLKKCQ